MANNHKDTHNFKGVTKLTRKANQANPWLARLRLKGKMYYGGQHPTPEAAARAYNELFLAMVPEMLNKIEQKDKS